MGPHYLRGALTEPIADLYQATRVRRHLAHLGGGAYLLPLHLYPERFLCTEYSGAREKLTGSFSETLVLLPIYPITQCLGAETDAS